MLYTELINATLFSAHTLLTTYQLVNTNLMTHKCMHKLLITVTYKVWLMHIYHHFIVVIVNCA